MHEKKITLIINIEALGDVMRSSFLAQALKEKTGNKIIWLTSKMAESLFTNNPYVDEVVTLNNKSNLKNLFYDEVINLEEDKELCKFASELEYKSIKGFTYNKGKILPTKTAVEMFNMSYIGPKPMNDILKIRNRKTHRQLVGEIAEVNWKEYEPFLKLTDNQIGIKEKFMEKHSISSDDLVIGINSGSANTWPKALSIKNTIELIEKIHKRYNCHILLFGGPNEVKRNMQICSKLKVPIIDTGCKNSLLDFQSLMNICNIVVSTDSLGLHIALALKKKVVVMIGPTSVSEIGLYKRGEKVVAKSTQVGTYSKNTDKNIMDKISLGDILLSIEKLRRKTISLIITSFKEKTLYRAIKAAMNQKTKHKYDVIVVTPDNKDLDMAKKLGAIPFKDPGKGKSFALNKVFKEIDSDILIFTDGDVYISPNSVEDIFYSFSDPSIGCVTGKPIPTENKKTKYGYWANVLFNAAHGLRKEAFHNNQFIECSGYLFAFRGGHIKEIPTDVAEDTYIPYFFTENGYRIGYVEKAEVYVKNVDNFEDWMLQKVRTSKGHESLGKYVDTKSTKRVKSLSGEAKGLFKVLAEPNNPRELYWTAQLILARGYMWAKVKADTKLMNKNYSDRWATSQSTK